MYVHQLPSGNWRVFVHHDGKRRTAVAPTKPLAHVLGAQLYVEMGGTDPDATIANVTVGDMLAAWQQERQERWSPTYAKDVANVLDRLPRPFTERLVSRVTPPIVASLYRELEVKGWSLHRISRVHTSLSAAWKLGVRYGWAKINPAFQIAPATAAPADIKPPSRDEIRQLIAKAPDKLALFLRLAASTGARRGELVALQWSVVELGRRRLRIRRSLVYTPSSGVEERAGKTGEKGWRWVALGAGVNEALAQHHDDQWLLALKAELPAPVWVFSHDAGVTPWRPDYPTLIFGRLRKTLGLEHVRLHDLRHFVATEMLAAGEPVHTVAGRLGHATGATTQRVYAHFLPEQDRAAADMLDEL